ncbi:PorT family protein [Flavobacteriales bacterium]|nr:PorT family protein [Flavobacteriales bacterium]
MKNLIILSGLVFFGLLGVKAQELREISRSPIKRELREDMLLLNFNWNTMLNGPDSLTIEPYSWGFDLQVMYDIPIQKSNFSFAAGGGLGISNFYTNSQIGHIHVGTDSTESKFYPISDSLNISRNKLTVTYADIPFELRYRSNPDKYGYSWKIALGAKVGYHLQTRSKVIQDSKKYKTYDYPNYEKWRYGVSMRVAYGRVGVSAFYSLTGLFDEGKGDLINPLSLGITLMPF